MFIRHGQSYQTMVNSLNNICSWVRFSSWKTIYFRWINRFKNVCKLSRICVVLKNSSYTIMLSHSSLLKYTWQLQLMYSLHTVEENRVYTFYLNKSRAWTIIDIGLFWSGCIQICLWLELIVVENTTVVEIRLTFKPSSSYFLSIWNKVLGVKGLTTEYFKNHFMNVLECKSPRDCYYYNWLTQFNFVLLQFILGQGPCNQVKSGRVKSLLWGASYKGQTVVFECFDGGWSWGWHLGEEFCLVVWITHPFPSKCMYVCCSCNLLHCFLPHA